MAENEPPPPLSLQGVRPLPGL